MTTNPVIKTDYFFYDANGTNSNQIAVQTFADGLTCIFDTRKKDGTHDNGQQRFFGALAVGEDRAQLLARFGIREVSIAEALRILEVQS